MKRSALWLMIILCGFCSCRKGHTIVSIHNESGSVVKKLKVEVYGQIRVWQDVNTGEIVRFTCDSNGDSHYSVYVEFEGGKTLAKDVGYVTHGADFDDHIVISFDDLSLNRPLVKKSGM